MHNLRVRRKANKGDMTFTSLLHIGTPKWQSYLEKKNLVLALHNAQDRAKQEEQWTYHEAEPLPNTVGR